jgi:predicted DsbA family dithiol-disulfide isomerase
VTEVAHSDASERSQSPTPVRFVVYSDYLCPWCYNAAVRLREIKREFGGRVELEWKSYLLRPEPRREDPTGAALEKFRRYTQSWMRPGAESDSGEFRVWESDEGPPTHSIPAHAVAKAAARVGPEAFERMHWRLLSAYFSENRDISRAETLRAIWQELELPEEALAVADEEAIHAQVVAEHNEAIEFGANGVPAVRLADNPTCVVGAQPVELYRRWIERTLSRRAEAPA